MVSEEIQQFHVLTLAERHYILAKQILTGQKTIVWKAWMLPMEAIVPPGAQEVDLTDEGMNWLRQIRSEDHPYVLGIGLPGEWMQRGQWVAAKIPRPGLEGDMREEAERLERLARAGQAGKARAISVVADLTGEAEPPMLILEWAPGTSLKETPAFDESNGLRLALQLSEFVQRAFLHYVILTDTLKPGSIFYDDATRSLVLLDWNTVGVKPDDMREITLPILGQTFYQLFTGSLVEFSRETRGFDVSGTQIGPDWDAEAWDRLSYGTRSLVTDLLLKKIPGARPEQIASNLAKRVNRQRERYETDAKQLLASARQATGAADCLNDYDLALGNRIDEKEDEQRYRRALYDLLRGLPLAGHNTAWAVLNWARRRFPGDITVRWAWLVRRATQGEPGLWEKLQSILKSVDQLGQTLEMTKPLASQERPAVRAMQVEAQLRVGLANCESAPTLKAAQALDADLSELQDIWLGNKFVTAYGDTWLLSLKRRVAECQERAERIQTARDEVTQQIQSQEQPTIESLERWQEVQPRPELKQLIEARRRFEEGDVKAARQLTDQMSSGLEDGLIEDVLDTLWRAIEGQIVEARRAVEQELKDREVPTTESLKAWQTVQDNVDLPGLIQAVESLEENRLERCMDALFAPDFPATPDELVQRVWNALQRASARKAKNRSRELVDQGKLQAGRILLERLDEYGKADLEAKAVLWLLDQFEKAQRYVVNHQPSEAYRVAYQETPGKLGGRDIPQDVLTMLSGWARVSFDRLVGDALHRTSSSKRDEAESWLNDPSVGIDNALAGAAAALDEAIRLNPGDAIALQRLNTIRAFQRGRYALLSDPVPWQIAESNLNQVLASGWNKIADISQPYAKSARAGALLKQLEQVGDVEACIQAVLRCNKIEADSKQLDEQVLDQWGDDAALKRVQSIKGAVKGIHGVAYSNLNSDLTHWLEKIVVADTALEQQETCARWLALLPRPQPETSRMSVEQWIALEPGSGPVSKGEYERFLGEWGVRLDTLFNYALAQAHLIRAGTYRATGRDILAQSHLEQVQAALEAAVQAGYKGPWPDGKAADAGLIAELHQQRRQIWTTVYKDVVRGRSIVQVLRQVEDYRDLDTLSGQHESLVQGVPKDAFRTLRSAAKPKGDTIRNKRDEWAGALAGFSLRMGLERLRSWDSVGGLIKGGQYGEALALATWVREMKPADQGRKPVREVQEAIAKRGRWNGEQLYERWQKKKRSDTWRAILKSYEELEQLDERYGSRHGQFDLTAEAKRAFRALNKHDRNAFAKTFAEAPVAEWSGLSIGIARLMGRQSKLKQISAGLVVVLLSLVIALAVYQFVPPVHTWVLDQVAPLTTASPPATVDVPPLPAGELTVGEPEPRQGGMEIWRAISVQNTGEVSGTFTLRVDPANVVGVQWFDADGRSVKTPETTLKSDDVVSFSLVLKRLSPFESEPEIGLALHVKEQGAPVAMVPVLPWPGRLQVTFAMSPTMRVQQVDILASGSFTPSLDGSFLVACYDASGALQNGPVTVEGAAGQPTPFTCTLGDGAAGEWHVAAFPQPTASEGWQPPETRPARGFPSELPFTVREQRYGIGISSAPVLEFDPGPSPSVGVLYTLWNTGEVKDRLTVEIVEPLTNVQTVTLSVSVVTGITPTSRLTGTLSLTHTLTFTPATGGVPVPLFPEGFELPPCSNPQHGECEIVRLAVVIDNQTAVNAGNPARLTLMFKPCNGIGEPVELPIEVTQAVDIPLVPAWLYVR
jgi:hypothetical protein